MKPASATLAQGASELCALLQHRRLQLAVAESCTGGLIGAAITMVAGSSAVFAGGVIAYSNPVKHDLLGVPTALLQTQGAVSAEVVEAMARGVQRLMKVHCALSVSGIAGPGGGSEHKPVGLVYIGMALGDELLSFEHHFGGDRQAVREQTALVAMGHVRDALQKI